LCRGLRSMILTDMLFRSSLFRFLLISSFLSYITYVSLLSELSTIRAFRCALFSRSNLSLNISISTNNHCVIYHL
jgi:hypothetical protein